MGAGRPREREGSAELVPEHTIETFGLGDLVVAEPRSKGREVFKR